MRRAVVVAGALAVVCSFLGCAAVTTSKIAFHEESLQKDDEAIIYVYRLSNMLGRAVGWEVRLDTRLVAVLRQEAYIALHVTPGPHTLTIADGNPSIVGSIVEASASSPGAFLVKAGQTYCVRVDGASNQFVTHSEAMNELSRLHFDMGQ